ncbi:hypothetical protein SAMN04490243_2688 [Robiginitalea myxolifaciens]|uniref:Patatin-like phospholipase n=1 Tax=Robiginitalea myxolifaciens TaxID=400055 RepID=A0A1I6HG72_9FLAO|nr:hypothetical protein [Robiginitalea myxolifaciens]SFR53247.1 hypothetical protein SAMN04490243_2688 [Robiginitalea myxolifaciens]
MNRFPSNAHAHKIGTHLWTVWFLLSAAMLICSGWFFINELLPHPQHKLFDHLPDVAREIDKNHKLVPYHLFFFVDIFWALTTLILLGWLSKATKFLPYFLIATLAYLTDLTEGVLYLDSLGEAENTASATPQGDILKWLVPIKEGLYVICLLFPLFRAWKIFLQGYFRMFLEFLRSSWLSLLFIALIYFLISKMDQGGTLIVALFEDPVNLFLLFFLLTFLALIISHFPVYARIWMINDPSRVFMKMDKAGRFLGFGTIYYGIPRVARENFDNQELKLLRRSLGILLYIAMINIFLELGARYYELPLNPTSWTFLIFLVSLLIYIREGNKYARWKRNLFRGIAVESTIREIVAYVRWFPFYFGCCLLAALVISAIAWLRGWDLLSLGAAFVCLILHLFLFIHFKISRGFLKYVFYSEALYKANKEMYSQRTLDAFKAYDPGGSLRGNTRIGFFFGRLSDNIRYLNLMRFSGIFSLICLMIANWGVSGAQLFNPIILVLLYIILFYSLLVLFFKDLVYYYKFQDLQAPMNSRWKKLHRIGIPSALVLIVGWMFFSSTLNNDLHKLREVPRGATVSFEEYASRFATTFVEDETRSVETGEIDSLLSPVPKRAEPVYFMASYGGGLKANLWNLLLLRQLDSSTQGQVLKRTAVLSGVSGGAVGIGNFTALLYSRPQQESFELIIDSIGRSNVLSHEIAFLLGRDWIQEYWPNTASFGKDRAFYSMQEHAKHTGLEYNQNSLHKVWDSVNTIREDAFPALIFNTTAVGGRQGLVSSVPFPETAYSGAVGISEALESDDPTLMDSALTYYGAVSTTNRFPFFSPSAKIEDVGNFLDGGYYDNSGMLAALGVYSALNQAWYGPGAEACPKSGQIKPVFVSIINSQSYYEKWKLKEFTNVDVVGLETGELASILQTIVSLDKLPDYALARAEVCDPEALIRLMMPHKLSYDRMVSLLPLPPEKPFKLMEDIETHNALIDSVLRASHHYDYERWGVVEPPLARLLSGPAAAYERAMAEGHPEVLKALEALRKQ